jgi:hypothetical protein
LGAKTNLLAEQTTALGNWAEDAKNTIENFGVRLETLRLLVDALQQSPERNLAKLDFSQSDDNSGENWERVRSIWHQTRERIELAIEEIKAKARGERYSKFDRYSYANVVAQLQLDGIVTGAAYTALVRMNTEFNRLRRKPGMTTAGDAANFVGWLRVVNGSLPKLTDREELSDAPALPSDAASANNGVCGSESPPQIRH